MKKFLLPFFSLLLLGFSTQFSKAQCPSNQTEVVVSIVPDNYPNETTWDLRDEQGAVLDSGDVNGGSLCVDTGMCLTFTIYDSFGDGICCSYGNGSYTLSVGGQIVAVGGQFNYEESTDFNCTPGFSCHAAIPVAEGFHSAPNADTWYSFVPDSVGTYTVTTCGLDTCDTQIWIYDHCQGLEWDNTNEGTIYYDDNEGGCGMLAQVNAILDTGLTYYIRIGDNQGACSGDSIHWQLTYNGPVYGCTDTLACNFNPLATVSDTCIYPPSPDCPDGPDLVVDQGDLETSAYLTTVNNTDNCWVAEGCINGYGTRNIIRFTTHIKNIGNQDYYIGNPNNNPSQFQWDPCHNHWHYVGYAEYLLYDQTGTEIPIGFKMGFCIMDLECNGGGSAQYGCNDMGITAGCGDIYTSSLDCQWIDITDIDTGLYTFVVRVNWDNSPDALGHVELNHYNNWAQICVRLSRNTAGVLSMAIENNCTPYVDCNGDIYGSAQPDCEGNCGGTRLRGDLDQNDSLQIADVQNYIDDILTNSISPTTCNDLNADNDITVYDPALLVAC